MTFDRGKRRKWEEEKVLVVEIIPEESKKLEKIQRRSKKRQKK